MVLDDAAWAHVRRLWTETNEPRTRIALRFGVAPSTIFQRALKEGWPKRPAAPGRGASRPAQLEPDASEPGAQAKPKRRRPAKRRAPVPREERVKRMLAIIDLQLEQQETDMAKGDELTVQDKERLGRQFKNIIASLEKITEAQSGIEKARAARDDTHAPDASETETMRREIAERLERLNAQWLARKDSE